MRHRSTVHETLSYVSLVAEGNTRQHQDMIGWPGTAAAWSSDRGFSEDLEVVRDGFGGGEKIINFKSLGICV